MSHSRSVVAILAISLLAAACSESASAKNDRCDQVNNDVQQCLGKGAPLFDCSEVSDSDLDAAEALASGPACAAVGEAPIDGDPASASCRLYGVDCTKTIQTAADAYSGAIPDYPRQRNRYFAAISIFDSDPGRAHECGQLGLSRDLDALPSAGKTSSVAGGAHQRRPRSRRMRRR